MGTFDKDKEIGLTLTTTIPKGEHFILWGTKVTDNAVSTKLGMAAKTELMVSRLSDPSERFVVNSLGSAIANKFREATAEDFPVIAIWTEVPTEYGNPATVVQWVSDYAGPNAPATTEPVSDIPF